MSKTSPPSVSTLNELPVEVTPNAAIPTRKRRIKHKDKNLKDIAMNKATAHHFVSSLDH
jgi:hypothetical protein